jgi:hypothetical protein
VKGEIMNENNEPAPATNELPSLVATEGLTPPPGEILMKETADLLTVIGTAAQNGSMSAKGVYASCMYGSLRLNLFLGGKLNTPEGHQVLKLAQATVDDPENDEAWTQLGELLMNI